MQEQKASSLAAPKVRYWLWHKSELTSPVLRRIILYLVTAILGSWAVEYTF